MTGTRCRDEILQSKQECRRLGLRMEADDGHNRGLLSGNACGPTARAADPEWKIGQAIGPLQVWISTYCNDVFGYIPSARVVAEGGYEARGIYTINGLFTAEAESVLVDKVRELSVRAGRKPVP